MTALNGRLVRSRGSAAAFAALVLLGSFAPPARAFENLAEAVSDFGSISNVLKLGIHFAEIKEFSTKDQVQNLVSNTRSLVKAQAAFFEKARILRVEVARAIEESFQHDYLRDLNAELDDLAIWAANGTLPVGGYLRTKAARLEWFSEQMAKYGAVAMPSFVAVNAALYPVNRVLGRSDAYRVNVYLAHARTMHEWITDSSDIAREYRKAHAVQSVLAITARTESPIVMFDIGRAFYKLQGVAVMSNLKVRIEHKSDKHVQITPIIHENVTPLPVLPDLKEGQILVEASQIPDIYRHVFSFLPDNKSQALVETVTDSNQADKLAEKWAATHITDPIRKTANAYVDDIADHDKRFNALERYITTIETSVAFLQRQVGELRGTALQIDSTSQIRALPVYRP